MRWFILFLFTFHQIQAYNILDYAIEQYKIVFEQFVNSSMKSYPHYANPLEDTWIYTTATSGWTSGFAPGVLWNIYGYKPNEQNRQAAINMTLPTGPYANRTNTDDVGFTMMCGFGNGYHYLKNPDYLNMILLGAQSFATRYSPTVRCTRSWDSATGFLVNIDNMMDLEVLFAASFESKNQTWHNIAWQHANRTMYEHFREDNSTYHFVEYNETDGSVVRKYQHQGYADWSTWSRGQGWGVYGYTMAYRYTKYQPFLDKAIGAANYFLSRIYNESDLVPFWDFDAPHNATGTYQPKDTSAGAIFASALNELSTFVDDQQLKSRYFDSAKALLEQLSSPKYSIHGNEKYKLPALLANGTYGPYPTNPYNVALIFGDYYFTQAALRLQSIEVTGKLSHTFF